MISINENTNLSASSTDSNGTEFASLNATITNGTVYISENITNVNLYLSNQETADADYAEFKNAVLNKARV